jgi:hypothetical protein
VVDEISTSGANPLQRSPPATVWTREDWADEWEVQPFLFVDFIEFVANPSIDQAQLTWRYGRGLRQGRAGFENVERLDVAGHYVKIQIDEGEAFNTNEIAAWYGVIVEVPDKRFGPLDAPDPDDPEETLHVPQGVQTFICWGLAWLLEQQLVLESVTEPWLEDDDPVRIKRPIGFNLGKGADRDIGRLGVKNRSESRGPDDVYLFAKELKNANDWQLADAIEYLLKYFSAQPSEGADGVPFELDDSADELTALQTMVAKEDCDGSTVRHVLDMLLDRRRGLGWHVVVGLNGDDEEVPKVHVFTFTETSVSLPGGATLDANASQVSLEYDGDPWLESEELRSSQTQLYDQIVVRGARRGSVVSLSVKDATIQSDWREEDQDAYNKAAKDTDGYGDLKDWEKRLRNDVFRLRDELKRVYSYFRLSDNFATNTGLVGPPEGDGGDEDTSYALPRLTAGGDGVDDFPAPFWPAGLRFERHLPLLDGIDYSEDKIELAEGQENFELPDGAQADHLAPMVFLKIDTENDRYAQVDKMSAQFLSGVGDKVPSWSASVAMQDQAAGLILRVAHSRDRAMAHKIAKVEFVSPDDADKFQNDPDLDWNDNLVATVYIRNDEHCEARQPENGDLPPLPHVRRKLIEIRDAYLDYVVPGTVVGLKNGELVTSEGGFIRDDRDRLRTVAKLAGQWYLKERRCLRLEFNRVRKIVEVGQLITTVGTGATEVDVNAVVTRVRYDLVAGKTLIETQHGEIDSHFKDVV